MAEVRSYQDKLSETYYLKQVTTDNVKVALPTCTNRKAQIRRYRRKVHNPTANPQNTALLQSKYIQITVLMRKEMSSYCDDTVTEAGKRILIFGTNLILEASNSPTDALFVDGTSKSCPTLFKQVWVIRVVILHTCALHPFINTIIVVIPYTCAFSIASIY